MYVNPAKEASAQAHNSGTFPWEGSTSEERASLAKLQTPRKAQVRSAHSAVRSEVSVSAMPSVGCPGHTSHPGLLGNRIAFSLPPFWRGFPGWKIRCVRFCFPSRPLPGDDSRAESGLEGLSWAPGAAHSSLGTVPIPTACGSLCAKLPSTPRLCLPQSGSDPPWEGASALLEPVAVWRLHLLPAVKATPSVRSSRPCSS